MAQDMAAEESITVALPSIVPREFNGDLSRIPFSPTRVGAPYLQRKRLPGPPRGNPDQLPAPETPLLPSAVPSAPMPSPLMSFLALSKTDACTGGACGGGWPPDSNGDVGPNHIVLTVNSSFAIFDKTGTRLAAFTENNLWSGVGSTPCNGNSQGDPVALYDWLADRFVITWFAFAVSGDNPVSPYYQCIAASKTSDPVSGGWWLYAVQMDLGGTGMPPVNTLPDYGKFGLWHDCLYMSANGFRNASTYNGVVFASFSRSDMFSGAPLTSSIGFLRYSNNAVFGMLPSNNNGVGANAVQPGTPNYFVMESFSNAGFEVRKFKSAPNCGAGGTLSTPTTVVHTPITFQQGSIVPQPNTSTMLDMIDDRLMQKAQYRKVAGVESVWVTHSVKNPAGINTATQWAQLNVTGGIVAATPIQQQIYSPDASLYRFMSSLAVDKQGNMALGFSTSNGTAPNFPSIAYTGRLATDPLGTLPRTEVQLVAGEGSQDNTCGGAPCDRWGDYSSMSVDPADDCTFWYTNQYYDSQTSGDSGNWRIRIGSFKFPTCTGLPLLTAAARGTGGGFVVTTNVGGINCGVDCSEPYAPGTLVVMAATPFAGSTFAGWGGACVGSGVCSFTISGPVDITATFAFSGTAYAYDYLQKAYVAYYGRPADPPGQAYWAGRLDAAGGSISAIIDAFGNSNEFNQRYGGLSFSALVTNIYQQALARDPDAGGLAFYVGELQAGRRTLQTIALDVVNGATLGRDATVVANKLNVAAYYTARVAVGCPYGTALDGLNTLAGVTEVSATVAAAKTAINSRCGP